MAEGEKTFIPRVIWDRRKSITTAAVILITGSYACGTISAQAMDAYRQIYKNKTDIETILRSLPRLEQKMDDTMHYLGVPQRKPDGGI